MIKPFSILRLTCVVVGSLALSDAQAHSDSSDSKNIPDPRNLSYDETDPTDVYAIPLDNSERDIDEEEEELEAMEERNLQNIRR